MQVSKQCHNYYNKRHATPVKLKRIADLKHIFIMRHSERFSFPSNLFQTAIVIDLINKTLLCKRRRKMRTNVH